jgi:CheY-like chemotaxis protein
VETVKDTATRADVYQPEWLWRVRRVRVAEPSSLAGSVERRVAGRVNHASVLIADDHRAFRRVVCKLLAPHFEVVGEAADGRQAVELARTVQPDVVVLDVAMPCLSGLEAARQLEAAGVPAAIDFLSVVEDRDIVAAALDAGGSAYGVKGRLRSTSSRRCGRHSPASDSFPRGYLCGNGPR